MIACLTWQWYSSGWCFSPWLFARYIRDLLTKVVTFKVGCNVGGVTINILVYADDLDLLAPSWRGLQYLLDKVRLLI